MPNDRIIKYYLLCSISIGARRHMINDIPRDINKIFTKKEIDIYFRKQGDNLVPNEVVIGGSNNKIVYNRIMVL